MATIESIFSERMGAEPFSLVDWLLAEQQQLTAAEKFAQLHTDVDEPLQARYYSALMPLSPPAEGEQYAFEVDLDLCSGCKACVTACHTLNGLDDNETWRDVGLLHGGTAELPLVQHVTTACHHCLEPACLSACPVNAYEKDPLTGIVRHLDDQCFGCQYCTLACPYDVPKFNHRQGIVRKCDMCSQRLAVGEAPACVQACPHEAIRINVVRREDVIQDCAADAFLPGAPNPNHTFPTTNYRSRKPLPRNTLPADYHSARPGDSHLPLVAMLVLTQLSVGAFLIDLLVKSNAWFSHQFLAEILPAHSITALVLGLLALGASVFHLGRPQYAFRAVLGLKHSWLSREIVAFGAFAALASAYALGTWLVPPTNDEAAKFHHWLGAGVGLTGIAGVFCSVMVYQFTQRPFWSGTFTGVKFLLTTLLLGTATALVTAVIASSLSASTAIRQTMTVYGEDLCRGIMALAGAKLVFEAAMFVHLRAKQNTPLRRTATLMTGELVGPTLQRFLFGVVGGIALPAQLLASGSLASDAGSHGLLMPVITVVLFVSLVIGELFERYLFFRASVAPRMPGGLST